MSLIDEPVVVRIPTKPPESQLVQNLRRLMAERGLNRAQLLRKAGLHGSVLTEVFSGKTRMPTMPTLQALASALDVDVPSLIGPPGRTPASPPPKSSSLTNRQIPVVAMAETGVLRATQDNTPQRAISGPQYRDFPSKHLFALEVRDATMDAATPMAFPPRSFALCVDMAAAKLIVESGKIYAVRRWRELDGLRHEEILVRRAQVFSGRVELNAETHQPGGFDRIVVQGTLSTDPEEPIHAFGLVYACTSFCYIS